MEIEVVKDYQSFAALKEEWERLPEPGAASLFSSFDLVDASWLHLREPGDRLFVLCVREQGRLCAVAPFQLSKRWVRGVPLRCIELIAAKEGDRATIATGPCEICAWRAIYRYLSEEHTAWDMLVLPEQPEDGAVCSGEWPFYQHGGYRCERRLDHLSFAISLEHDWEAYLNSRSSTVRKNWSSRRRKFENLTKGLVIQSCSTPEQLEEALARFIAIERAGWKKDAGVGISRTPRHLAFYRELLQRLIRKGVLSFHFLRAQGGDAAGLILANMGARLISLHIAYHEQYAAYSPAIMLRMEVLRGFFKSGLKECDLLGLAPHASQQRHKLDWATDSRRAFSVTVLRRSGRAFPLLMAAGIKRLLLGQRPAAEAVG